MSVWRKALNLPDKNSGREDEFTEALAGRARNSPGREEDTTGEPRGQSAAGWTEEAEPSGRIAARKAGRALVWGLIVLAALTGVRAWVFPAKPASTAPKPSPHAEARKDDVPEDEARRVAARFARSYMTWNQDQPQAREEELARDLPKGADTKAGWNGQGVQLVAQTVPGEVVHTRPREARVTVDVRVSATAGTGKQARTQSQWRGLEVPVAETGGRVIVTGPPALVGLPEPVDYTPPSAPDTDSALSEATRQSVGDFLTAWAAGSEDQAAAPGAAIAPLGQGMSLGSLESWRVQEGSGDKRTGAATVRWKTAGAQLQQTYEVTVTQVRAGGASRWQVWSVTAP
ncbi:conjugal transfer protein [Streptomyces sp. NPDC001889]